jgi:hypothetical protein
MIGNLPMTSNRCDGLSRIPIALSESLVTNRTYRAIEKRGKSQNGPVCPIVPIPETPVLVTFVTCVSVLVSVLSASSPIVKGYV